MRNFGLKRQQNKLLPERNPGRLHKPRRRPHVSTIANATQGTFNSSALGFLVDLDKRLRRRLWRFTRDILSLSAVVRCHQRLNSVLIRESFAGADEEPDLSIPTFACTFFLFFYPGYFNPRYFNSMV